MGGDMVWIMTPIIRLPGRANETVSAGGSARFRGIL